LTLFYRYFKPLIENGNLYLANPPLYKISKGKEQVYVYSDEEKEGVLKSMGVSVEDLEEKDGDNEDGEKRRAPKVKIQRYKGLGEMNADELYETTMDKEKRILKQIKIEDAAGADAVFDVLMGSEVPPRKAFIVSNAKMADIDL
jgi:DNA gyrase subunit B